MKFSLLSLSILLAASLQAQDYHGTPAINYAGDLVINEFMASNDSVQADQDGEFDDWIELYNNTSESISLDGFFLSDDPNDPGKWSFPAGTTIAGNDYLIVWADNDEEQEGLHASFRLSAGGESVLLMDADTAIIDSLSYGEQLTDLSFGRFPNGTGDFTLMNPTFSAENSEGISGTRSISQLNTELQLFPNPGSDQINVKLESPYANQLYVSLLNSFGQLVLRDILSAGVTSLSLETARLPTGNYLLTVTDGRAIETRKVILQR